MPYTALVLFSRKEGVTPAEFQDYFEGHQIPYLKETAGEGFPITHTRIYVQRTEEGEPSMLRGSPDDFPFDGIAIMEFEDEAHGKRFTDSTHTEEQLSNFTANPKLPDRTKARAVLVSKVVMTKRDD